MPLAAIELPPHPNGRSSRHASGRGEAGKGKWIVVISTPEDVYISLTVEKSLHCGLFHMSSSFSIPYKIGAVPLVMVVVARTAFSADVTEDEVVFPMGCISCVPRPTTRIVQSNRCEYVLSGVALVGSERISHNHPTVTDTGVLADIGN
jgi:hypothetical protein